MGSHWHGLISKGVLASLFLATLFGVWVLYSLFWLQPASDSGRQWLVQWRPMVLRNGWTQTPGISAESLKERLRSGQEVWLVDVREREERLISTLPGAMTPAEFEENLKYQQPDIVVAYCTIGVRSGVWVDEAVGRGWPVFNLDGGALAWAHIGGELVDQNRPTKRLHVVSDYWDLAPADYETVW